MAKVTSKRQVTVPKELADRYGIEPGTEIDWQAAGDVIRVVPPEQRARPVSVAMRLEWFDAATERQRGRQGETVRSGATPADRGWTRDDLYGRGPASR